MTSHRIKHPARRGVQFKATYLPITQRGMTLLELLVVMVILAMVSALLVQGMGTALVTYERVQHQQQQSMQPTLAYGWLEQTISGVQAELDKPRQFTGTDNQLSGYTHRPLIGESGQVSAFSWLLKKGGQGELQLWYQQPRVNGFDVNWLVLSWPVGSTGSFKYLNHDGNSTFSWPEAVDGSLQLYGQIPSMILLEIILVEGEIQPWYVLLPGRTFPRVDYRDF